MLTFLAQRFQFKVYRVFAFLLGLLMFGSVVLC